MNIHAEFRLTIDLSTGEEVELHRCLLPQAPARGEIVNINGNPYRVSECGWGIGIEEPKVYAYITVDKATSFTVVLGGRKY